jgi:hypothetical protein
MPNATDVFDVRKKLFVNEDDACASLGVLCDWVPFDTSCPLSDAVAQTYFWFVPGSRHEMTSYTKSDLQMAFNDLCVHLDREPCVLPDLYSSIQDVYDAAMPQWRLVHGNDCPEREAYLALLLKDFAQASKLKTIDTAKAAKFLAMPCKEYLETTVKNLQQDALSQFCQESTEQWMTYKYWLQNMNLFDRENEEVLTILFKAHLESRMPKAELIARCEVSPGEGIKVRFSGCGESCACTKETPRG